MKYRSVLEALPYAPPFLFVDALEHIDDNGAKGSYTFLKDADFYKGHFKEHPVTPGVLLTECCAQIGLVSLGIYLLQRQQTGLKDLLLGMSSAEMEFLATVHPGERVTVISEKQYFRFQKLKCKVNMYNEEGTMVCKGTLAGMIKTTADG